MYRIQKLFFILLPVLLLSACSDDLTETSWVLTRISGDPAPISGRAHLQFHQNGDMFVEGSGGCNRFSGTFAVREEHLHVGPLIATRMACPDMREEQAFFNALQRADAYRFEDGRLILLRDGKPLLEFKAQTAAAETK